MTHRAQHSQEVSTENPISTMESPESEPQAQEVTPEERQDMIAEAAYYIAEQRGFQGDLALNDWLQAEAEIVSRDATSH